MWWTILSWEVSKRNISLDDDSINNKNQGKIEPVKTEDAYVTSYDFIWNHSVGKYRRNVFWTHYTIDLLDTYSASAKFKKDPEPDFVVTSWKLVGQKSANAITHKS